MKKIFIILSIITTKFVFAQFAPAADVAGSTAIQKDSSIIVSWATGFQDYFVGDSVDTTWQHPENALGKATGTSTDIVSLGRGGEITFYFDTLIINGEGPDFATFENGFTDNFLELAWVEVSYDGINFERFPNYSYTQNPVDAFGTIEPTKISGYCSKYRQGYGTPFDLDSVSLDTIRFVKIIDIIGDSTYFDTKGNPIYDPYPTTGSAGVDIDAIGVINAGSTLSSVNEISLAESIKLYPNPAKNNVQITINNVQLNKNIFIYDIYGKLVHVIASKAKQSLTDSHELRSHYDTINIDVSDLQKGIYFIKIGTVSKKFVKM